MSYIFNSTKRNRKPNSWFRSHHKMRIQESGIRGIKRGLNGHWEDARLRTLRSQSGQMWRCSGESFLCWLCSNTTMLFCLRFVLAQCKGCLQKLTAAPGTGAKKKKHISPPPTKNDVTAHSKQACKRSSTTGGSPLHTLPKP